MKIIELSPRLRRRTRFEEKLFAHGFLKVDDKFFRERGDKLSQAEIEWLKEADGKVPASWQPRSDCAHVFGIVKTFKDAGREGVDLSPALKLAGITHPTDAISAATFMNQRLDLELIKLAFMRGYDIKSERVGQDWGGKIYVSQREKGVWSTTIQMALNRAEREMRGITSERVASRTTVRRPDVNLL